MEHKALLLLLALALCSAAPSAKANGNAASGLSSVASVGLPTYEQRAAAMEQNQIEKIQELNRAKENATRGWEEYKQKWNKTSRLNSTEDARGAAAFSHALSVIESLNQRPGRAATFGLGPFADMDKSQFIAEKLGLRNTTRPTRNDTSDNSTVLPPPSPTTTTTLPDAVNWVTANKVVPIKSQGGCGSCWTFAATAVVESSSAIETGALYSLSEQQILDCGSARADGGNGCNGGALHWGLQYVIQNGGQTVDNAYPYSGSGGEACNTQAADWKVVQLQGYQWVSPSSEQALMEAVAKAPVLVGIASSSDQVMYYAGGVLNDFAACCPSGGDCSTDINHAVAVVGYNKTGGWWLVRNSWGTGWGEGGYMYLAMGTPAGHPNGMCGLLAFPIAPVKDAPNSVSGTAPPGAQLINLASSGAVDTSLAGTTTAPAAATLVLGALLAMVALVGGWL